MVSRLGVSKISGGCVVSSRGSGGVVYQSHVGMLMNLWVVKRERKGLLGFFRVLSCSYSSSSSCKLGTWWLALSTWVGRGGGENLEQIWAVATRGVSG